MRTETKKPLGIHDAQPQEAFAHRLAAPQPFANNPVTHLHDKKSDGKKRPAKVKADQAGQTEERANDGCHPHDAGNINEPRQAAGDGTGQRQGKGDAFRRADDQGADAGGVHGRQPRSAVSGAGDAPDFPSRNESNPNSISPKIILKE